MKKNIIVLVVSLLLIIAGIFAIKPVLNDISYGIDLQGGFEILYRVEPLEEGEELSSDDLENTYKAIVNRIDTLGVSEPVITIEGDNLIRVQLPGVKNEEEARNRISTTAVLSFRDTDDNLLMTSEVLKRGRAKSQQSEKNVGYYEVQLDIADTSKFYLATKKLADLSSTGKNVMVTWLDFEDGVNSYSLGCDTQDACISAANVSEGLRSSSVVITGNFTKESADTLAELINSGSLPTKLVEDATPKSVSPSFGEETIAKTGIAGLIAFGIICLILIAKYRLSGVVGSFCLFAYAVLVFVLFNAVDGVLTLTGIAALVLGVGMAVDSIIISNERVKEELTNENSLIKAYNDGSKSSLVAIIDANITTFIAGVVLYMFGESSVRGFATMLIITIFVTVFTAVIWYRVVVNALVKSKKFNNKKELLFGKVRNVKQRDYVKFSKYPIILSSSIIVLGIIFALVRGFNFGVDFTGGTNISLSSENDLDFDKIIEVVKDYDVRDYDYYVGTKKEGNIILNDILDEDSEIKVKDSLNKMGIETSSSEISNLVTKSLTKNAIKALIYSLLAIIIYVAIRFNINYAISGILMLIHDVLIIISFFAIFHISLDFIIVAALLTIIGYSINDTIVVFDKVRENRKKMFRNRKKLSFDELVSVVNKSSSSTFSRNIWTSITTIVSVVALIAVGLNDIITFNIAILIGLIAGTISSLLIGPRLWISLEFKSGLKPEDDDDDEVEELKIKGINS